MNGFWKIRSKNLFPETTIYKTFEKNSCFYLKLRNTGNLWFLFFSNLLMVATKCLFWEDDWALNYHSMKCWDFPDLSWFPKILRLNSCGNSWGNLYIPSLLIIIALRSLVVKVKIVKTSKILRILWNWLMYLCRVLIKNLP